MQGKSSKMGIYWLVAVVALVLVAVLDQKGMIDGLKGIVSRSVEWGWSGSQILHRHGENLKSRVSFWWNGPEKIADLETRLAGMSVGLGELKELRRENDELRKVLNIEERRQDTIMARLIVSGEEKFLVRLLQEGEATPGQAVVSQGELLGTVESVTGKRAWVKKIDEKGIGVTIAGTRVEGAVIKQGVDLEMAGVWQSDEVKAGEVVVTLGSQEVPRGIVVGVIESVGEVDSQTQQKVKIRKNVEVSELEYVWLIKVE